MAEVASATNDADVMARAFRESRLLLTGDKDFGDLAFRRGGRATGIVLLRVDRRSMHSSGNGWMRQ